MKKIRAYILTLACLIITLNFWVLSKDSPSAILVNPMRSASQIFGLFGIILTSISLILATRARFIEKITGGLDKVYDLHKIVGSLGFIFVVNHPLLLVLETLPNANLALNYLLPFRVSLAYTAGELALYLFILSLLFIVFVRLPYNLWKYTHKLLGLTFLLSAVHAILIGSDLSSSILLTSWVMVFIFAGISSAIYIIFLYRLLGPKHLFRVDKVERKLDIVNFYLKNNLSKFSFYPGQFVYAAFPKSGSLGNELHPYSISSAPSEETIRISAKILGDYTLKLPEVKIGDEATVYGPYGAFGEVLNDTAKDKLLWIAGGIGATPFLSMLRSEFYRYSGKKIVFFYSYSTKDESVFESEINWLTRDFPNIKVISWCSFDKGRLGVKNIMAEVNNVLDYTVLLCGPYGMMTGLSSQLTTTGLKPSSIISENFSML